jgi:hypothetical protein
MQCYEVSACVRENKLTEQRWRAIRVGRARIIQQPKPWKQDSTFSSSQDVRFHPSLARAPVVNRPIYVIKIPFLRIIL